MTDVEEPARTMEEIRAEAEEMGFRYAYGSLFPPISNSKGQIESPMADWQIEAHCLRAKKNWEGCATVEEGERPREYQGYVAHFMAFVSILWPKFEWNPNAVKICREMWVPGRKFLGIAGHASSSKTESLAYFSVAFFLIDPENTMVIVTSKTVEIAQKKIWGSVKRAWNQLSANLGIPEDELPGNATQKAITYVDRVTGHEDTQRGLMLMPGEQNQYRKSADKYQGIKAPNVMVSADELATLSPAIVETAISNLTKNPNFIFVGAFNPETHYDAARKVAMPKAGWGSISERDMEWETDLGYCIRFDGTKSPNVLDPSAPWTGLYTRADLERDLRFYHGDKTAGFWTMVRGFWPPMGIEDAIYSSQEIEMYRGEAVLPGQDKGFVWLQDPTRLAGLDPSYRPGGDAAVLYFGLLGRARLTGGKWGENGPEVLLLQYTDPLGPLESPGFLVLAEDVTKAQDKPRQVAEALKRECERRSIRIENVGIDITGAASFGSLVRMVWGDGFLEVDFSQSPSDTPISDTDPRTAKERYADRPSELWYSGKYLLWTEQLKGITPELAQDMVSRSYEESGGKVRIESKEKMKLRIGRSPDKADAAFVCLDVARQRHGLTSVAKPTKTKEQEKAGLEDAFAAFARRINGAAQPGLDYSEFYRQ